MSNPKEEKGKLDSWLSLKSFGMLYEMHVCVWFELKRNIPCDHHLVGGVAHVVWLDVVDAALLGPGEGADCGKEEGEGQKHHGEIVEPLD